MPDQDVNLAAREAALTSLFSAVGLQCDAAKLRREFADAGESKELIGSTVEERLDWVGHIGHDLGLRTSLASATVEDALTVVRGGQALVTTDGKGRWFVLRPTKGGKKVELLCFGGEGDEGSSPVFVSASSLRETLVAASEVKLSWLVGGAAAPNELAVSEAPSGEPLTPFQRLLRLMNPERQDVLVVVIFAITIGFFLLATPIAVQSIVNSVALGGTLQPLVAVAIFLALALTFAATLSAIQTWVVELIQRRLFVRAFSDLAGRLPRVQSWLYDSGFRAERVNRFFDVLTIQKSAAKLLIDALGVVLAIIVGLGVLAFYHPFLLAFDLVLLAVIAIVVLGPRRRGERTAIQESSAKYEVAAWLEEIASSPLAFRNSGSEAWVFERADALSRNWVAARSTHFRTLFGQILGALALQVVASTSLLAIGGVLVIQGSLTLGQLVAAELIVSAVVASVAKMGKFLETWYDLIAALAKVGSLLDLPVESSLGEHHGFGLGHDAARDPYARRPKSVVGAELEMLDVSWSAKHGPTRIEAASLCVKPGERVALTGLNGAERLAMVDLVWRLRIPDAGVIRLDGRDLRDLSPDFLRREVSVVSQIEVIHGSVRDNVRLRRGFVSNDDARVALECVGLREVFARFEGGLDEVLHPDARLIGDDDLRQLMLARAIAGDPRLLVIDSCGSGAGAKFRQGIESILARDDQRTILVLTNESEIPKGCDRTIALGPTSPQQV